MKKAILSTVVVLALVLGMAISSFAVVYTAPYASSAPVIDGQIDAIWESAPVLATEESGADVDGEATGYLKLLWDKGAIYYLAVVNDATPIDAADESCTNGVNLWVSETNTKADTFDSDIGDYLYFLSSNGVDQLEADKLYIDNAAPFQVALGAVVPTAEGYIVEVKIPSVSHTVYTEGHIIGFTCSIDDDFDANGERDDYNYTARATEDGGSADNYWSATAALAEVQLGAATAAPAPVEPAPAPVEPAPAPVEPAPVAPSNPSTADVTAIFYALASLSAVAGLAISKRK